MHQDRIQPARSYILSLDDKPLRGNPPKVKAQTRREGRQ
jgi:hypothetical protein